MGADVPACVPLAHSPAKGETRKEHAARHETFVAACDQCQWGKHGHALQELSAFANTKGERLSPIMPAPLSLRGSFFKIGCSLCFSRFQSGGIGGSKMMGRSRDFALFEAHGHAISKQGVKQHVASAFHRESLRRLGARDHALERCPLLRMSAVGEGADNASVGGVPGVPDYHRFAWAAAMCWYHGSFVDYGRWIAMQESTSPAVTHCLSDKSTNCAKKLVVCHAESLRRDDHDILRRAVRLSFSEDDANSLRSLRVRVAVTRPRVRSHEMLGPVMGGFGTTIDESAAATVAGLHGLCSLRKGPQRNNTDKTVDYELFQHVCDVAICAATDGCEVAVQGVQQLKRKGPLVNLRYQFRDRAHGVRTVTKGALKYAAAGAELMELLVSARNSFCKRCRYVPRFKRLWVLIQMTSVDELFEICRNLSHSEVRFTSRSKPLQALLLKFHSVVEVLVAVSLDRAHPDDAAWAEKLVSRLTGVEGFNRIVKFALDCDFGSLAYVLTAKADKRSPDVALAAADAQLFLNTSTALFHDLGAFEKGSGTYTDKVLESLRQARRVTFGRARSQGRRERSRAGW